MRNIATSLLISCLLWSCSSQVVIKGRSEPLIVHIRPPDPSPDPTVPNSPHHPSPDSTVLLPAHLVLVEKKFEEPDGNQVLDAEEAGTLVLRVSNDGLGPGKVGVRLTPLGDMEHLNIQRSVDVGLLSVQETKIIQIPIQAS